MKQYAEAYRARHGTVKVLGMSQPVPLHQVFTAVRVVPHRFLGAFVNLDQMHEAFESAGRQHPAFSGETIDGIQIANTHAFLNLLGAPGAGKSTFLRRLGQEALLARKVAERIDQAEAALSGHYKHSKLPVLIELRMFRSRPINLTAAIAEEFINCGFPESHEFVQKALEEGALLVLLDGLDEVPNDKLDQVINHVCDFVDKYGLNGDKGNRFVTSCRTAHYKNAFTKFTDVVLADFGDEQISQFATNWFSSPVHRQTETARRFFETLKDPANVGALELSRTPLLLTFLCLTYDYGQELPPTRATLYRRALDLLLREWAAEKRVHNEPIYQELNGELELDMLSELAHSLFKEARFFFGRSRVTNEFREFMNGQLNAPKTLDVDRILEAIEVQQGLIVRRAQDTYSFSHLTIQEYLTARQLWGSEAVWKQVVADHFSDNRWAVVFELMAGLGNADPLLLAMAHHCQQSYLQLPVFVSDIQLIDRIGIDAGAPTASASHRLMIASFILTLILMLQLRASSVRAREMATSLELVPKRDRNRPLGSYLSLARSLARDVDRTRDLARTLTPDLVIAPNLNLDLTRALDRACELDRAFTRETPMARDEVVAFARAIGRELDSAYAPIRTRACELAREQLGSPAYLTRAAQQLEDPACVIAPIAAELGLETGDLGRYFEWSKYLDCISLLARCRVSAYRVSTDAWQQVCRTILCLPRTDPSKNKTAGRKRDKK